MIHRAGLPPVLSCILLMLLSAPMIALGLLWAAFVVSGDGGRAVILGWMTIALVCAAICILAEVLLAPFVLGRQARR